MRLSQLLAMKPVSLRRPGINKSKPNYHERRLISSLKRTINLMRRRPWGSLARTASAFLLGSLLLAAPSAWASYQVDLFLDAPPIGNITAYYTEVTPESSYPFTYWAAGFGRGETGGEFPLLKYNRHTSNRTL